MANISNISVLAGNVLQASGSAVKITGADASIDVSSSQVIITGSVLINNSLSASQITGSFNGSFVGNSATATALQTSRTISSIGDVVWSVSFDGSNDVSGTATIGNGVIVDANINSAAAISDTKLATISTAGKVSNSATTATSNNTANAIVARDASGNFTAGSITATAFTGTLSGDITGNAATVTNGVYTVGAQSIGGVKSFTSSITGTNAFFSGDVRIDRKSTRLNSSHVSESRMPSSA